MIGLSPKVGALALALLLPVASPAAAQVRATDAWARGTVPGRACLAFGLGLELAAWVWMHRLVRVSGAGI